MPDRHVTACSGVAARRRGAGSARLLVGLTLIGLACGGSGGAAEDAVVPLPVTAQALPVAAARELPLAIRVVWGGGKPRRWNGSIRVIGDTPGEDAPAAVGIAAGAAPRLEWSLLSADAAAGARVHCVGRTIAIHQPADCALDGVEIRIADWPSARVVVELVPDGRNDQATRLEVPASDLIGGPIQHPLDDEANRLTLRRAPADEIRVAIEGGAVRFPGDTVRLDVQPLLPPHQSGGATYELRLRVRDAADGTETFSRTCLIHESTAGGTEDPPGPQRFEPLVVEAPLPPREGAFDLVLEVSERGGLRWTRPLATRTVQVAAITSSAPRIAAEGEWRILYEHDPNSPRLLERIRRLPVMGRNAAAVLPHVPMPVVAIPKVPLPSVPIPKLPAVAQVVPKLTGPLPAGHSSLEPHPAGALFRLPPARAVEEPSWEAILLASAVPGMPHRIQIDHPLAEDAILAVTVLEQIGATVVPTFQGGFTVEGRSGSIAIGRYDGTFWPHTRSPLIVISNPSLRRPASFGTVRVLAGPAHLPAAPGPPAVRSVHAFIDQPDLGEFGGLRRVDPATGRALADWRALLLGVRTGAERFAAQGLAGAMVTVYADGAAAWPSVCTGGAPRWDSGGVFEGASDPVPKDSVEVLCRVFRRHALRLVPAISCNGPLVAIEGRLAADPAGTTGLVVVDRDGRPRRVGGPGNAWRYNILDPRVQAAVEELVTELAGRLSGRDAVDGLALVIPHDGWFHLPGTAAAIDDVTFGRFVADTPDAHAVLASANVGADRRHALRAALVEGPLREAWLDWRAGVVAGFVARLADRLAERDPDWTLSIVPTTLLASGELADRFRPVLAAEPADADLAREIGLDPARLTAHPGVVWVTPQVHVATDDLVRRDAVRAMNRSGALVAAAASARRRAAVSLDMPEEIDLRSVLAHGPFGGATAAGPCRYHASGSVGERVRSSTELMAVADCERIYDAGLLRRDADDVDRRLARLLAALPASTMQPVTAVGRPLSMRVADGPAGGVVVVANRSGVPCRAVVDLASAPAAAVDALDASPAAIDDDGRMLVELAPWQTRAVLGPPAATVRGVKAEFDPGLGETLRAEVSRLRRKRSALEVPVPLAALDNPGFEHPDHAGQVPGWELLEPQRGRLRIVTGAPDGAGRAVAFGSDNGLATLRSNPFPPPLTGRISIALWLRIAPDDVQPQLRIALEGVERDREYYRFATVGGGGSSRPLGDTWSQFVLQVDDLPTTGLESLRVRLDLLAGGEVQVDDVRVFDLAFDESQRVQLSKALSIADHALVDGDLGGCAVDLDGHWARFLDTFVSDEAAEAAARVVGVRAGDPATPGAGPGGGGAVQPTPKQPDAEGQRTGLLDRVRRWWK